MVKPAKTVALPPNGNALAPEEISLLGSVDVHIANEGGVTVVGVPNGADECVLEQSMKVLKDGGADCLARCLANMSDKQAASLIAAESLGQRTSSLERVLDTRLSLEACRRADNGAQWACEEIHLPGAAKAESAFRRGVRIVG